MEKGLSRGWAWVLSLVGIVSIVSAQVVYDQISQPFHQLQIQKAISFSEPLVPSTQVLKFLSLGDQSLTSDLLWLETIQYFGVGTPYGKYRALGPMLNRITQLDPQFEYPYEFGMIVLPYMDNVNSAISLGNQAVKQFPQDGLLAFYHATNYLLFEKNYVQAHHFYDLASKEPGSPSMAATLAATSLDNIDNTLNDRLIARDYWQTIEDHAKSKADAEMAAHWVAQMQLVYDLESMALNYKQVYGHFPASLQALVDAHYLKSIPVSPVQRVLKLDPKTGRINFDQVAR
jgi:hypothetical protein